MSVVSGPGKEEKKKFIKNVYVINFEFKQVYFIDLSFIKQHNLHKTRKKNNIKQIEMKFLKTKT